MTKWELWRDKPFTEDHFRVSCRAFEWNELWATRLKLFRPELVLNADDRFKKQNWPNMLNSVLNFFYRAVQRHLDSLFLLSSISSIFVLEHHFYWEDKFNFYYCNHQFRFYFWALITYQWAVVNIKVKIVSNEKSFIASLGPAPTRIQTYDVTIIRCPL